MERALLAAESEAESLSVRRDISFVDRVHDKLERSTCNQVDKQQGFDF